MARARGGWPAEHARPPRLVVGRPRGDAIEELRGFLPAPQVLAPDLRLRVVRKLLDANRFMFAPETQLAAATSAQVPHPLDFAPRRHQISRPADLRHAPATRVVLLLAQPLMPRASGAIVAYAPSQPPPLRHVA